MSVYFRRTEYQEKIRPLKSCYDHGLILILVICPPVLHCGEHVLSELEFGPQDKSPQLRTGQAHMRSMGAQRLGLSTGTDRQRLWLCAQH